MSDEKPDGANEAGNVEAFICNLCEQIFDIDELFQFDIYDFCPQCYDEYLVTEVWTGGNGREQKE